MVYHLRYVIYPIAHLQRCIIWPCTPSGVQGHRRVPGTVRRIFSYDLNTGE